MWNAHITRSTGLAESSSEAQREARYRETGEERIISKSWADNIKTHVTTKDRNGCRQIVISSSEVQLRPSTAMGQVSNLT